MLDEAEQLVRNLIRWFLKAEERNIYELETSVGNPPLREPSLKDAQNIHRILTSLCGKVF
jgi:hypothetical protein